jgi:hypothetical protein
MISKIAGEPHTPRRSAIVPAVVRPGWRDTAEALDEPTEKELSSSDIDRWMRQELRYPK